MLSILLVLLLSGLVILLVGSLTSSLQVKDFGSGFGAALGMTALGWLLSTPLMLVFPALMRVLTGSADPPDRLAGLWAWASYILAGLIFVENLVLFCAIALVMPGITVRGPVGPLLVAGLVTAVGWWVPAALMQLGLVF